MLPICLYICIIELPCCISGVTSKVITKSQDWQCNERGMSPNYVWHGGVAAVSLKQGSIGPRSLLITNRKLRIASNVHCIFNTVYCMEMIVSKFVDEELLRVVYTRL